MAGKRTGGPTGREPQLRDLAGIHGSVELQKKKK
jgi:hypothetical protein